MTIREKFETALKLIGMTKDSIDSGHVRPNNDTDLYKIGFRDEENAFTLSGMINSTHSMVFVLILLNEINTDNHFELLKKLNELNLKYSGAITFVEKNGHVMASDSIYLDAYDLETFTDILANLVSTAMEELPNI